jgi:hypothetical protein
VTSVQSAIAAENTRTSGYFITFVESSDACIDQNTVMTAVIPDMSTAETIGNIEITPLTSMAQARARDLAVGMTRANIASATSAMGQYFDISDILTTHPMDLL